MRILHINKFLYPKGGDAVSTLRTGQLQQAHGHEVAFWGMAHPRNPDYLYTPWFVPRIDYQQPASPLKKLRQMANLLYSREARARLEPVLQQFRPAVAHVHNFAHQLSPSILDTLKKYNLPVVMTMHDFKLVCPAYSLLSRGKACEACRGGHYYHCLLQRCTKNSRVKSLLNTLEMYLHHNLLRIYHKIDIFLSPSRFMLDKIKAMGFRGKLVHLPFFVDEEEQQPPVLPREGRILYAGRLSPEKGLGTLLTAVKGLAVAVTIAGEGPLRQELEQQACRQQPGQVHFTGYLSPAQLKQELSRALLVVLPSLCYENYPTLILEAFARGIPVVASRSGGIPELVQDGQTGYTFPPGNAAKLRSRLESLLADPRQLAVLGSQARQQVRTRNQPELFYRKLIRIYRETGAETSL